MKKIFYSLIIMTVIFGNISMSSAADKKNKTIIYVKNFVIDEGLNASDPIKNQVRELIQEEFEKDGRFFITADEDISAVIKQEEKAQSFGKCSSESCIQELMEKINAQIIIFGRIRKVGDFTYITARYMDQSSGVPRVSKIRTIKYHYPDFLEKGVRALAEYLISGDDDDVVDFMDEVYTREEQDFHQKNSAAEKGLEEKKRAEYREQVEKAAKEREKALTSRSPIMRFGYGFYVSAKDEYINDSYPEQSGYFADVMFGRDSILDGHLYRDFYLRFLYKTYETDETTTTNGVLAKDVTDTTGAELYACDFGLRIKASKYLMITAFDPYILAAVRSGIYREKATDNFTGMDTSVLFYGYGWYFGGGLEFAFFENLGFFAEYNTGTFKLGDNKVNFEGHQVYGGLTLRTQFL